MGRPPSALSCRSGTAWRRFKRGELTRSLLSSAKLATSTRSSAPSLLRACRNNSTAPRGPPIEAAPVASELSSGIDGLGRHLLGCAYATSGALRVAEPQLPNPLPVIGHG